VLRACAAQRLASALDERLGEKIRVLPGVERVDEGLVDMMTLRESGRVPVLVQGWLPDAAQFDVVNVLEGSRLTAADAYEVMLGNMLAERLGKKVGDDIALYEKWKFKVVGVYRSDTLVWNAGLLMPLRTLQEIMERKGQVTGFMVVIDRPDDKGLIERLRQEIGNLDKRLEVFPTDEFVRSANEIRFVRAVAWLTSALALIIGLIGVLNTMTMSVFERTREIGILRAVGWDRRGIMWMVLLEAGALALGGTVLGIAGGSLLLRLLCRLPAVAGLVRGVVGWKTIGEVLVLALAIGLMGAIYPAYRAARIMPTEAIRHD
jgi:putative ABC transport system permease protein